MAAEDLALYGAAALVWLATIDYLLTLRYRQGEIVIAATVRALLCLSAMLLVLLPPVYVHIDQITRVPNSARFIADALLLLSGWAIQPIILHFSGTDEHGGIVVNRYIVGVLLAVMAVFFALRPHEVTEPGLFTVRYGGYSSELGYTLTALIVPCLNSWRFVFIAYRINRAVSDPVLRWRESLQVAGWVCAAIYAVYLMLSAILMRLGVLVPSEMQAGFAKVVIGGWLGLQLSGQFFDARNWFVNYRDYRALDRLWRLLYHPSVYVRIDDYLHLRNIQHRLMERRVTIYDAVVRLEPFIDPTLLRHELALACCETRGESGRAKAVATTLTAAVDARAGDRVAKAKLDCPVLAADDEHKFLRDVSRAVAM